MVQHLSDSKRLVSILLFSEMLILLYNILPWQTYDVCTHSVTFERRLTWKRSIDRDPAVEILILSLETRVALHPVLCSRKEVHRALPDYVRSFQRGWSSCLVGLGFLVSRLM